MRWWVKTPYFYSQDWLDVTVGNRSHSSCEGWEVRSYPSRITECQALLWMSPGDPGNPCGTGRATPGATSQCLQQSWCCPEPAAGHFPGRVSVAQMELQHCVPAPGMSCLLGSALGTAHSWERESRKFCARSAAVMSLKLITKLWSFSS